MGEDTMDLAADKAVEAILRDELTRENRAAAAVVPVLHHLLSSDAHALVSDVILARVRGMVMDCAGQLLAAMAGQDPVARAGPVADPAAFDTLVNLLLEDAALLGFCHALANEGLLADRLQQRHAIDPVLSPLLQELIASDNAAVAGLAMSALAAQSRFIQSQRRMELPLGELPAEFFHAVIARAGRLAGSDMAQAGLVRLQQAYDEGVSRIGLLGRLVAAMRKGVVVALALDHAGLALFASALAAQTRNEREAAVLACHEGQGIRLAVALHSAGVGPPAIERQLLLTEPVTRLPRALGTLSVEQTSALLQAGRAL